MVATQIFQVTFSGSLICARVVSVTKERFQDQNPRTLSPPLRHDRALGLVAAALNTAPTSRPSTLLEIMLLITCIYYSHARWIRNPTTIICYTPLLKGCSTIISFRRYPTFILHTRRNRIKLESHCTETGTLTITEHQLYPRFHAQPMAGHFVDTLGNL